MPLLLGHRLHSGSMHVDNMQRICFSFSARMPIISGGECFFRNEIKYSHLPLSNITLVFQSHSIAILCLCTVAAIIASAKRMLLILSSSNVSDFFAF